jgi:hypothetical protein
MRLAANGGVDAAARFHSSIAGPIMMQNTPPPLASNEWLGCPLKEPRNVIFFLAPKPRKPDARSVLAINSR